MRRKTPLELIGIIALIGLGFGLVYGAVWVVGLPHTSVKERNLISLHRICDSLEGYWEEYGSLPGSLYQLRGYDLGESGSCYFMDYDTRVDWILISAHRPDNDLSSYIILAAPCPIASREGLDERLVLYADYNYEYLPEEEFLRMVTNQTKADSPEVSPNFFDTESK